MVPLAVRPRIIYYCLGVLHRNSFPCYASEGEVRFYQWTGWDCHGMEPRGAIFKACWVHTGAQQGRLWLIDLDLKNTTSAILSGQKFQFHHCRPILMYSCG